MTLSLFEVAAIAALVLLGIGFYGLLAMRHMIKLVIALQILEKGALLAFIVAAGSSGDLNLGQSLATTIIVVDTIVAVVGLALAVKVKEHFGTLDVHELSHLRG